MNQAKWAALFPGQGSQTVGMTKELFGDFKIVRETFEEASDASKLNLKKLCFEGPEDELTLTENTQPCLLTASVACFRVAQTEFNFTPALVAGHSLGEYSALVAAGAIKLSDAAYWVRQRGAAMQMATPAGQGKMAAVMGLEDPMIEKLCDQASTEALNLRKLQQDTYTAQAIVRPANFNSPGQVVIAGSSDAVDLAIQMIKTLPDFKGGKAIPLNVSAPFHSPLMKPAKDQMAKIFSQTTAEQKPKSMICPYIPNRTAKICTEPGVIFELLIQQVDHPVLWKQSMLEAQSNSFTHFVEFGPGKVLQGLLKRISQSSGKPMQSFGVSDVGTLKIFEEANK